MAEGFVRRLWANSQRTRSFARMSNEEFIQDVLKSYLDVTREEVIEEAKAYGIDLDRSQPRLESSASGVSETALRSVRKKIEEISLSIR
jgi:hypothetical protein